MKKIKLLLFATLLVFGTSFQTVSADDMDDLSDLSEDASVERSADEADDLSDDSDLSMDASDPDEDEDSDEGAESGLSISFGGYVKALGYWNQEKYSDLLWGQFQEMSNLLGTPIPEQQDLSGFNNVGTRMQLKIEGFLGDKARLFAAANINFNQASSLHADTSGSDAEETQNGDMRMVESFLEIYQGSRTWKIGSQIVTWSFLEGMEVPTDRINARDNSYKSTEYEDSKLPSTGILLTQNIFDSQFEVLYIPVARTNIGLEFQEYIYPGADEEPEQKPNNGKWAARFSSSLGNLDYAVSYVDGIDPNPDLVVVPTRKQVADPTNVTIINGQPVVNVVETVVPLNARTYNRVQSPGLDLQYNFGSWLGKLSYAQYLTEDSSGDSAYIKNNWNKYVVGGEISIGGSTVNLYAGQQRIEDFHETGPSAETNFLLGQMRNRTDFISGHINADFLTGNALNLILMGAQYWDGDGESVQAMVKATLKYKIADGLEVLVSPMYMDMMDNTFYDFQTEVKYSF